MKIGIDFHGVCDIPNAFECLYKLKDQGHKLYLLAYGTKEECKGIFEFIMTNHIRLFIHELYITNIWGASRLCDRLGLDMVLSSNINILWLIPVAHTIHFRYGDDNPYHNPKAMFTAYSWDEAMEIISHSVPLDIKPKLDVYLDGMLYQLVDI